MQAVQPRPVGVGGERGLSIIWCPTPGRSCILADNTPNQLLLSTWVNRDGTRGADGRHRSCRCARGSAAVSEWRSCAGHARSRHLDLRPRLGSQRAVLRETAPARWVCRSPDRFRRWLIRLREAGRKPFEAADHVVGRELANRGRLTTLGAGQVHDDSLVASTGECLRSITIVSNDLRLFSRCRSIGVGLKVPERVPPRATSTPKARVPRPMAATSPLSVAGNRSEGNLTSALPGSEWTGDRVRGRRTSPADLGEKAADLFYRSLTGERMFAVRVVTEPTLKVGAPVQLFQGPFTSRQAVRLVRNTTSRPTDNGCSC